MGAIAFVGNREWAQQLTTVRGVVGRRIEKLKKRKNPQLSFEKEKAQTCV